MEWKIIKRKMCDKKKFKTHTQVSKLAQSAGNILTMMMSV